MTSVSDIRRTFLDFFEKNGHTVVPSAGLIPANDPTLMFTAAGMVQFKNVFTGTEKRPYTQAVSVQKCLRAGGKHNDLENVGYTARHHTFFEMLGNFSFGDYFKEEAIKLAWDLVNKEFGLSSDKLLVTVYHTDDEAADLWKKIAGFPEEKIIRIATDDNFWSAGDTGPCGPSSEIFYDYGEGVPGGPPGSPEEDGDRFVEIWNNVFMQYDRQADGTLNDLPNPSIDTGQGLERMASVLQGRTSVFDTDLIRGLVEASADATSTDPDSVSHKVIADHLRASCFMIAEGILPSNEGRGYVLRRIMRRAMRHAHLLGATDPLMHRLVPALQNQMGKTYPELYDAGDLIEVTLEQEELRFKKTLDKGLALLQTETDKLGEGQPLPGGIAFKLYDTFGFPLDLTQDVLRREQNRSVDIEGFDIAMQKQKAAARAAWSGSGEAATDKLWFDIADTHGATEFLGYTQTHTEALVQEIINADGQAVASAKADEKAFVVTNQTPFYAESGGQVGDTGALHAERLQAFVTDTQKKVGGVYVHHVDIAQGILCVGDTIEMQVDAPRRDDIRANHSATHLLHAALRRHLGTHVAQKGSLVDADRLRFDISQPSAIPLEKLSVIEEEVNDRIRANSAVSTHLMQIDDARAAGALAMFGEKYDDEVRVLGMGGEDDDGKTYSVELCGGTHVTRTGDIGLFKILSDSALAAGVRRIEALTGRGALEYFNAQDERVKNIAATLKAAPAEAESRVEILTTEKKKLEKELTELRRKLAAGGGSASDTPDVKDVGGIKFTARILNGIPAKDLKPLADDIKTKIGSGVVALVSVDENGKASLVVGVTSDLTEKINAVTLVKAGAAALGGKGGGGRPDMAQAGGPDGTKASDAAHAIEVALAS